MLNRIAVDNLRVLRKKEIFLSSSSCVFVVGKNGSGKTTLLESIVLPGYGFLYGVTAREIITHGEKSGRVEIEFKTRDVFHVVEADIDYGGVSLKLDGKSVSRRKVKGLLPVCWYFPQDISLVLGGSEERRMFIDRVCKEVFAGYNTLLRNYRSAVSQRLSILKEEKDVYSNSLLDAIEEKIAQYSLEIVSRRLKLIEELNRFLYECLPGIVDHEVNIIYRHSTRNTPLTAEIYVETLYVSRGTDQKTGKCSVGPHRDRIELVFEKRNSRYASSYGERKVIALALKLAERKIIEERTGRKVIFLADDLFSELDNGRKNAVLTFMKARTPAFVATATELPGEKNMFENCEIIYMS